MNLDSARMRAPCPTNWALKLFFEWVIQAAVLLCRSLGVPIEKGSSVDKQANQLNQLARRGVGFGWLGVWSRDF